MKVLFAISILCFVALLSFALETREYFTDTQIQQCFECSKYFSDGLVLADPTSIAGFADAHAAFLIGVLDSIVYFVNNRPVICTSPPKGIDEYMACLNKYVSDVVKKQCQGRQCTVIATVVDDIIGQAQVCADTKCDNTVKYPRAEEQALCRATSKCKSIEELESNVRRYEQLIRNNILVCKAYLRDANSECAQFYTKVIKTKQQAAHAIDVAAADRGQGPTLGSGYGKNATEFDLATMVLANQG